MDIREQIRSLVTQMAPHDKLEKSHIADILQWIDSGAPLFRVVSPDEPPKHLVAYFVLIDPEHKSLLLVDHIKALLWLPTGGHVQQDEDPRATVGREAHEELGIPAVFLYGQERPFFATVTTTAGLTPGHTDVSLWYLLRGSIHQYIHYEKRECNDAAWFSFTEIMESDPVIFDPHLQRFTQKLMAYLSGR